MDLGIAGRKALICASSSGLGLACAQALAREGCDIVLNGRDSARLSRAAEQIETRGRILEVAADLNEEQGRAQLLAACPDADILVTNNAGPPPGPMAQWNRAAWLAAVESNMLAPIEMIQALLPGMIGRRYGRIVNITSAMVKSPHPLMGLSTAPRAGLTAFAKAVSRDAAAFNVTINNLLPERIDTARQEFMVKRIIAETGVSRDEARRRISDTIAAKRFGLPSEFGDACAFLCSAQAGFISGQNLQLDGGSYQGLL